MTPFEAPAYCPDLSKYLYAWSPFIDDYRGEDLSQFILRLCILPADPTLKLCEKIIPFGCVATWGKDLKLSQSS